MGINICFHSNTKSKDTPVTWFYNLPMLLSTEWGKTASDLLPVVSRKPAAISFRALCHDLLSATRRWRQGSKITATATTKTAPITVSSLSETTAWRQRGVFFALNIYSFSQYSISVENLTQITFCPIKKSSLEQWNVLKCSHKITKKGLWLESL